MAFFRGPRPARRLLPTGHPASGIKEIHRRIAYVMQDDVLMASLTVAPDRVGGLGGYIQGGAGVFVEWSPSGGVDPRR